MLPERIRLLDVSIGSGGGVAAGELLHQSQIVFTYRRDDQAQLPVGLLMPATQLQYRANTLFPVMDQNLPEGYLFQRLREAFPKQALSAFHLLALIGDNGIGRLGFHLTDAEPPPKPQPLDRNELLHTPFSPALFEALVNAYLSTGIGIAGMQPKILIPDRATVAVPNLIVKTGTDAYPGLAANEFLCLTAACHACIKTPDFELSDDGQLLLIDRFDIEADGTRLAFEDVAALMGLCVRDTLADRKYHGSYERVVELLKLIGLPASDLVRFFEQVALTVMVRNGDAHLKNFGVLYRRAGDVWLSPLYDVVTTAIYRYARYDGGPELEDRTLALRLFRQSTSRAYPMAEELLRFGRTVCGVHQPAEVLARIAVAMQKTLAAAAQDARIPSTTLAAMQPLWARGIALAG